MIANGRRLSFGALLALFLVAGWAQGRAAADSMTVDEIRDCMCRERALQSLREETNVQQTKYNDARQQLQSLETQISNMRKTMNPEDDISVQILSEMIRQRDTLNTQIRTTTYPQTQDAVSKLNAAVSDYNQRCTQRAMLKTDVDNASRDLTCPPAQ
ncbi:MAG TPA: hypothetical protein VHA10_14040 [Hypericibacter adhaerens]|nr:hypothetical protein [Hypericibacter adhaerens]HWA44329.1 hypothetical protein [Hypericibacter adhaerens]